MNSKKRDRLSKYFCQINRLDWGYTTCCVIPHIVWYWFVARLASISISRRLSETEEDVVYHQYVSRCNEDPRGGGEEEMEQIGLKYAYHASIDA